MDGLVAGDAFVSALLHDLGEALLMEVEGVDRVVTINRQNPEPAAMLAAQEAAFGCNHAQLGAACLESWGLPEGLCLAVLIHHDPVAIREIKDPPIRSLAEVVWMADQVDRTRMGVEEVEGLYQRLCDSGLRAPFDIGKNVIEDTLESLPEELERLAGADGPAAAAPPPKRRTPRRTLSRRRGAAGWRKVS